MKKLYLCLLGMLLALLLGFGIFSLFDRDATVSASENRKLNTLPKFSLTSLVNGEYTAALEAYYTDTFPLREQLLAVNRVMNKFYYFGGSGNLLTLDYSGGAEKGGESLADVTAAQNEASEPTTPTEPNEPSAQTSAPQSDPEDDNITSVGTIIIEGDRAMDIPTATDSIVQSYGAAATRIADAMGADIRTFVLATPNAGAFYAPESYRTGAHDQKSLIDLCYGSLGTSAHAVDAYSALAAHTGEDIFFRTDHHWTQQGAYYAYTAYCASAGLTPDDLSTHQTGQYEGFVGSMYTYTSGYPQSEKLKDNPDTLRYYLPTATCSASYYADTSLQNGIPIPVIDTKLNESVTNKYLCFLCGDSPITIITTDASGGTCMVLKESYGNAFVPFLTSHYSKIITVDPREFNDDGKPQIDLAAFAKSQGVNDLLIINYPFMVSSADYVAKLQSLIK